MGRYGPGDSIHFLKGMIENEAINIEEFEIWGYTL